MKRLIVFTLLFLVQNSWGFPQISFTAATPPQFSFEIADQGLTVVISEQKSSRKTTIKPKYTVSDAQKILITPQTGDRLQQTTELLLVVLAQGAQVQRVQIFIPVAEDKVIQASQTDPICDLENFGDFSWEKPAELQKRVRLVKKGAQSELQLQLGKLKNSAKINSVKLSWQKCFSF